MQLSGIGHLLEAYRTRLRAQEGDREAIAAAIFRASGVEVSVKDMTISRMTLSVRTDAVTRSQLFLYKAKILEEIKKTSVCKIFDIK